MIPAFCKKDIELFKKYLLQSSNYFEFGSGGSTYQAYKSKNIKQIYSVESSNKWIYQILDNLKTRDFQVNTNSYTANRLYFFDIEFNTKMGHLGLPLGAKGEKTNFLISSENTKINSININEDNELTGFIKKIQTASPYNHLIEYRNENDELVELWVHPKLIKLTNQDIINKFNQYSDSILKLHKNVNISLDLVLIDGRFRVMCALKTFNLIDDNCIVLIDDFRNRKSYHVLLDFYQIVEYGERMVALKKKNNTIIPQHIFQKYENDVR